MHPLRTTRLALPAVLALLVLGVPPASSADGVIDLTWGTVCSPLVSQRTVLPATSQVSLIASVRGIDVAHTGYSVNFSLGDLSSRIPDAWQFDLAGCPGPQFLTINHLAPAPAAGACPSFQGAASSVQIRAFNWMSDANGNWIALLQGRLTNTYSVAQVPNPGQRYFLAQFIFNHTYSVAGPTTPGINCGGVENPIVIRLLTGNSTNGSHYRVAATGEARAFEPGLAVLGVNGAVPTDRTTWGAIKNQYRR